MILLFSIGLVACSSVAPEYQPNGKIISQLRDLEYKKLKTGVFSTVDQQINRITIRGGAMKSPYNNSYAEYLKYALQDELKYSNLWDENAELSVEAIFIENELDASGASVGHSNMAAKFIIKNKGNVIYEHEHRVKHEWESSFIGAVAIPAAQSNYVKTIQMLIEDFLLSSKVKYVLSLK